MYEIAFWIGAASVVVLWVLAIIAYRKLPPWFEE